MSKRKYQPTERERAVLRKQAERREAETPALRVEVLSKGATLLVDHPDATVGRELLMEALGTANAHFSGGLLHLLRSAASATEGSRLDQDWFNFMLAVITGIKPNDQLEAMLAAQMAAGTPKSRHRFRTIFEPARRLLLPMAPPPCAIDRMPVIARRGLRAILIGHSNEKTRRGRELPEGGRP